MGCEEMDVKLIESDDDGVDMGPSKMTVVECRESLKGIAKMRLSPRMLVLGMKICYKSNNWQTSYCSIRQSITASERGSH